MNGPDSFAPMAPIGFATQSPRQPWTPRNGSLRRASRTNGEKPDSAVMTLFVGPHVHGEGHFGHCSTTTPSVSMTRTVRRGFTSLCSWIRHARKADVHVPLPNGTATGPLSGQVRTRARVRVHDFVKRHPSFRTSILGEIHTTKRRQCR